jgi:hypothetical protein
MCTASVPLEELVVGYPKLAGQMEILPEIAIFRRFGALNARSLLYQQAELIHLEKLLNDIEQRDRDSGIGSKPKYARNWYWLSQSADDGDEEQLRLVKKIRRKLRKYSM